MEDSKIINNIINYLKERINDVDKVYKEKEEITNKRNCLIVQKYCYEEIIDKINSYDSSENQK